VNFTGTGAGASVPAFSLAIVDEAGTPPYSATLIQPRVSMPDNPPIYPANQAQIDAFFTGATEALKKAGVGTEHHDALIAQALSRQSQSQATPTERTS